MPVQCPCNTVGGESEFDNPTSMNYIRGGLNLNPGPTIYFHRDFSLPTTDSRLAWSVAKSMHTDL